MWKRIFIMLPAAVLLSSPVVSLTASFGNTIQHIVGAGFITKSTNYQITKLKKWILI